MASGEEYGIFFPLQLMDIVLNFTIIQRKASQHFFSRWLLSFVDNDQREGGLDNARRFFGGSGWR